MSNTDQSSTPALEIAHVLFMDIVAYSRLPMDEQTRLLSQLQQIVRATAEFQRARQHGQLLRLPTGDGMALVFFDEPEAPARCAIEIARALRDKPDLKLRMGVHTGPVQRVEDINANLNVAGGGINLAQRVMDCGDAGHIMVSKAVADVLGQMTKWNTQLHDLGEVTVKHGVRVHVFNLFTQEAGNPSLPKKVQSAHKQIAMRRSAIATAVIAALAVAVLAGYLFPRRRLERHAAVSAMGAGKARRAVAVIGFKNLTGHPDEAWLSTALSEMLTTELGAGGQLRTIPGETVSKTKLNLSLPDSDSYASETLDKIRLQTDADDVVLGAYLALGEAGEKKVRVDLKLQDSAKGETIATVVEEGTETEAGLSELVNRIGSKLRDKLGAGQVTSQEAAATTAALPSNTDALRLYSEGLAKLRVYDNRSALALLQTAVAADPKYALAHMALSDAWGSAGNTKAMMAEAKKAFDLSSDLSREDRLWIEGRYHANNNENDKALQSYKTLFKLHPDNLEYGLRLAGAQKQNEALETVRLLRALPPPTRDDPRIDLAEAQALWETPEKAVEAAERAMVKAEAHGDRTVVARALGQEGMIEVTTGRQARSFALYKKAKEVYEALGDRNGVATMSTNMANDLGGQGDLEGARKLLEESLAMHREIGNEPRTATDLQALANIWRSERNFDKAVECLKEALSIFRTLHMDFFAAFTLDALGFTLTQQGDLPDARKYYAEALATTRRGPDKNQLAFYLTEVAERDLEDGNLGSARKSIDEAAIIARQSADKMQISAILDVEGGLLLEQNQLDKARHKYNESLSIMEVLGRQDDALGRQLSLGIVAMEEGNPRLAEAAARQAEDYFHKSGNVWMEPSAGTVLARALFEQGKYLEATKEVQNLLALWHKRNPVDSDVDDGIIAARLDAVSNKYDDAENSLNDLLKLPVKTGKVLQQYQIRLALGEIEMKGGQTQKGRARLAALERETTAKGYLLIAHKAAAARASASSHAN